MSILHRLSVQGEFEQSDNLVLSRFPTPHVLHLELNRPHARNSINDEMAATLGECFEAFDLDQNLRVAVLSGRGAGFSAGLDLKAFLEGETGMHPDRGFAGLTGQVPEKPVIAAVEGFALAGGFEIALACDLIVAARDAKLGIPEVQRGLVADGGALIHLPRRVPYQVAMELALIGDPISGERAEQLGLIARAVTPGDTVGQAIYIGERIAQNAPLAVRATKKILTAGRDWPLTDAWDEQNKIADPVWTSDDAEEGARAFAARRIPHYRGS